MRKFTMFCGAALFLSLPAISIHAQFRGGHDDGAGIGIASNQPLGRNTFFGGSDDGTGFSSAGNQPLGRNIFAGGNDDGIVVSLANNQALGRNIFLGGSDDGVVVSLANNQLLGRNIFLGGNDDGINTTLTGNQPLGRNIFSGGVNDGWAMAFVTNTPLPVTLTDFNGQWQLNDALLFWQTSSEQNTSHFELERSTDGTNFLAVQRIHAAGQSNGPRNYQYTDVNIKKQLPPTITTVYYRLRSVDRNGTATYSGIVVLKVSDISDVDYAVFPNPAKDYVTITASQLPAVENIYIRLADASGKVLSLQKMIAPRQQISVLAFAPGTYFLQLISKDKVVYTQKIIIHN